MKLQSFTDKKGARSENPRGVHTAHIVESVQFFLVILLTAEPVRILKMEVPQVSYFESFTAELLRFLTYLSVYC